MKKKIRISSFILALLMLISVMPLSLFAADTEAASVSDEPTLMSPLDLLASKATGELYTSPDVTNNSAVTSIERNGYWGADGSFGNTQSGGYTVEDLAASEQFTYSSGASFGSNKGFIYSIDIKRGDAMPDGFQFAYFKTNARCYLMFAAMLKGDSIVFQCHVKNHWQSDASLKAAFSTSLYTNVSIAYDNVSGMLYLYVNGILVDSGNYNWYGDTGHGNITNTAYSSAIDGNVMSLDKMSIYTVAAGGVESMLTNTNPANGVFKIDGDYYYFENGIPVLGRTLTVDGYNIVTEANTGKITECSKPQDMSDYYDRWTEEEYTAAGVTLLYNTYGTSFSAPVNGYVYETVTEDDITYYLIDPTKTNVREYYIIGTDVGDGFELTKKEKGNKLYYSALPESYETVTDEDGNTRYKTSTAPTATINLDLTYTHEFANATVTTGAANVNIRLKAGKNFKFDTSSHMDVVSMNFDLYTTDSQTTGTNTRAVLGQVKVVDNAPHLFMSGVDCGIIRSDIYTDLTIRTYISDGKLVYDLYVNGVLQAEGLAVFSSTVAKYKPKYVRYYSQAYIDFTSPYATFGVTQLYYGDKVNSLESGYSGDKMSADGVYTYENGIAVSLTTGVAADSTVGIKSYSVTLGETLGMNLYTSLPKNADNAVISVDGKTREIDLKSLTAESDGFFKLTAKISSINVSDEIFVAFYNTDGEIMPIYTSSGTLYENAYSCSVKDYALTVAGKERIYGKAVVEVTKAMLNYAAYAENYFGKNTSLSTAYSEKDAKAVTALDAAEISGTVYADSENAADTLGSIQLILENTTLIRINLTGPAEFSTDCENVCYVEEDGKYYVYVCAIDAKNLDTVYTFYVNGITVAISATGVAKLVASSDDYSESFVNLMKAIYLYSAAANALA